MNAAPVKPICHVSIPRSGHHMLVSILSEILSWGQFIHCETYDFPGCCRDQPCRRVAARCLEAFGTDRDLRLYLQKSHDMANELSLLPQQRFIAQLRHPLQATIGWLRWHQTPIPASDVTQAAVGFLAYYLRFFHKWVANDRLPDGFRIRYEDLVAEPEQQLRAMLAWAGVEFDEARLQHAVTQQVGIDAHTGTPRTPGASRYRVQDYLALFGPMYARLLPRLASFCPGLPYLLEPLDSGGAHDEMLDEWIFSVDLRQSRHWHLELSNASQMVAHPSIQGRLRIPHAFGFGFSPPETGYGSWTDGDVCIVPFRSSSGAHGLEVCLAYLVEGEVDFERMDLELVANGRRCLCSNDNEEATALGGRRWASFIMPPASACEDGREIEGCLVLRFVNLRRVAVTGEQRKLGRLLSSIDFTLVDAPAHAGQPPSLATGYEHES